MTLVPAFFDLKNRRAVVVGGGDAAVYKLRYLAESGAEIALFADPASPALEQAAAEIGARLVDRAPRADDFAGVALAFIAVEDENRARRLVDLAKSQAVPVNAVDRPHLSTFIVPAVVRRDPVMVAISSQGTSPVLAKRIRQTIEALLPTRLGNLARFAKLFRPAVEAKIPHRDRRLFWERFFDGAIPAKVLEGRDSEAREAMLDLVNRPALQPHEVGQVSLVGAGPGDADLLTLKALSRIQQADVIFYDSLVSKAVLDRARRDARLVLVGKRKGRHSMSQDQITAALIAAAKDGQKVVRLKGGDPTIFARAGEELAALQAHGIACDLVPGVTAALGAAARLNASLTLRGTAQSLTLVTAHGEDESLDWSRFGPRNDTLAIYMGRSKAKDIEQGLLAAGWAATTPVAAVENATLESERVIWSDLADFAQTLERVAPSGPTVILLGEALAAARELGREASPYLLERVG